VVAKVKVLNDDGIVLAGENAVLDASESFVTNREELQAQDGLNFTWVCPNEIIALCIGKSGPKLEITEEQFLSVKGKFNLTYVISVRIAFTRRSGVIEVFRSNANVRWVEIYRPVFKFNLPYSKILVTAERQTFRLTFKNSYVLNNINFYQTSWSITPNISSFALTNKNLTLTVNQGNFQKLTNYSFFITMQHTLFPQA